MPTLPKLLFWSHLPRALAHRNKDMDYSRDATEYQRYLFLKEVWSLQFKWCKYSGGST